MSDLADLAPKNQIHQARPLPPRAMAAERPTAGLKRLADFDAAAWQALADRAVDPNGYYLPDWELAVNACTTGRGDALALAAWAEATTTPQLVALLPVISVRQAFRLPIAALVSADPYGVLGTPLLDSAAPDAAARALIDAARACGQRAILLRDVALEGAALAAITRALAPRGLAPRVLHAYARAGLDATRDADTLLDDALGAKKLKELRRQRRRLAEHGAVSVSVARTADEIGAALETFLVLEASGWKARRGTSMAQSPGDVAFMRQATSALAARGACEIVTLSAGTTPVASGVVLRHRDRAFWFKLGVDERFAKVSPGVQLALELTRHFCADPAIRFADSTATPDHPMINPIWRGRLAIGDVLIPLSRHDPAVALLQVALAARRHGRNQARRVVHGLRRFLGRR